MSSFSCLSDDSLMGDPSFLSLFDSLRQAFQNLSHYVEPRRPQLPSTVDMDELHEGSRPLTADDIHVHLQPPDLDQRDLGRQDQIVTPPTSPRSAPHTPPPIHCKTKSKMMRRSTSAPPPNTPIQQKQRHRQPKAPKKPKKPKQSPFKCSNCHQVLKHYNFSKNQLKRPLKKRRCRNCVFTQSRRRTKQRHQQQVNDWNSDAWSHDEDRGEW